MNPIKNFVYVTLQIVLGVSVLGYAAIRYRDVHDFDNTYYQLDDWFTRNFAE